MKTGLRLVAPEDCEYTIIAQPMRRVRAAPGPATGVRARLATGDRRESPGPEIGVRARLTTGVRPALRHGAR